MNREYYYLENGVQKGPIETDQLKLLGIKPDTLVFTHGFDNWKPANEVNELKFLFDTPKDTSNQNQAEYKSLNEKKPIKMVTGFIEPGLSYVDSGKMFRQPFSWLYILLAAGSLILPFYILYVIISGNMLSIDAENTIAVLLAWVFLVAACWVGFQIWWNRKDKVLLSSNEGAEFPITPVFSHFVQTIGEWLGAFIAIAGFGIALVGTIIQNSNIGFLSSEIFNGGFENIIVLPVMGFLTICFSRFLAEMFRCLTSIANNTKK